jgi:thiamine biosynthesis protein ThiI
MKDIILLKQGEMVLKGLNKHRFDQRLQANIRYRIRDCGKFKVYSRQSIVYVEPADDAADVDTAFEALKTVFGIITMTRAAACEKDRDAIAKLAVDYLREAMQSAGSFKVETRRGDKSFPMTSIELSQFVGGELSDAYPDVRVDVHNPELIVNIEIRDYAAFVHGASVPGAGGMPLESNGRAVTMLSGGIDSPVSTWMIARRGVKPIPVHFFSFPYTSEQAKEKVVELTRILTQYCGSMTIEVVPFTHIQEEIRDKCPERYFTLIMRRFMMRISDYIAKSNGCGAIITGENLGQVASQTMEAMAVSQSVTDLPVLQPLVGMDKEDIVRIARKIGTFDTSILPYEDCCTVFTPRHPETRPTVEEVAEAESALDVQGLIDEAVGGIERIRVKL